MLLCIGRRNSTGRLSILALLLSILAPLRLPKLTSWLSTILTALSAILPCLAGASLTVLRLCAKVSRSGTSIARLTSVALLLSHRLRPAIAWLCSAIAWLRSSVARLSSTVARLLRGVVVPLLPSIALLLRLGPVAGLLTILRLPSIALLLARILTAWLVIHRELRSRTRS